ncbi:hypothetical protein GYA49_03715 [Candidatus Beckwithbacteria bacterium]|nr:hypothetical protein [Candidatus Beckwithbacteria bacterium]
MKQKPPEINFLTRQRTLFMLQSKRMYLIQMLSFGTLIAYGFVLLSLVSYSAYLGYRLTQTNKGIDQEKKTLERLSSMEVQYYGLKNKSEKILGVYNSLYQHQETMDLVFKILPSDLEVQSFSVDEEGDLTFSASTPKIESIGTLFENIQQYQTYQSLQIENVTVNNISVNDLGEYSFGITIKLGTKTTS